LLFSLQIGLIQAQLNNLAETSMGGQIWSAHFMVVPSFGAHFSAWCIA